MMRWTYPLARLLVGTQSQAAVCPDCQAFSWPELPRVSVSCECTTGHFERTCDLCGYVEVRPDRGPDCG